MESQLSDDRSGVHYPAWELPAPKVTYASGSAPVQNGGWGLQDVKFHRGAKVSNSKVLMVCDGTHGITPSDPSLFGSISTFVNKSGAVSQISRTIELFGYMQAIDFILVLLPPDDHLYSGVKQPCDLKFGKLSTRLADILVDVDVSQPSSNSPTGTPSIVGVATSVDSDSVQFPASVCPQKSRGEIIEEILQDMVVERLRTPRQRSDALPQRMVAVDAEDPKYHPTLSVIICGKRHRVQFFPSASADADAENSRNTHPGMIVDRGVASDVDFDFYLQAHAGGLHSTPKSTHYVVIYDESAITPDAVQQGVHSTSYLYAPCSIADYLLAGVNDDGKSLSRGKEKPEAD
ncbi:ribonuclease H-like domain-containing protein [Russula dissimulans]|nr:ribonuclease H-like domain-containing protein [Russula dissimulans]